MILILVLILPLITLTVLIRASVVGILPLRSWSLRFFVIVVDPGEDVDNVVDIGMVVETGMLRHMDMDIMTEEP